jgi:thymidylate synthase (FAD)
MRIIKPNYVIDTDIGDFMLLDIERYGRTAYKSEAAVTDASAESFVRRIINNKHLSVIEHISVTVRIVADRGVTHELVRHRLASYTQESTRYCNYSASKFDHEITVIEPVFFEVGTEQYRIWYDAMLQAEKSYMELTAAGASPQQARSVLPNSLKTEIVVTMNLREWRHFFILRTAKDAHPQMRQITIPLLKEFQSKIPVVFEDIEAD